MDEHIEVRCSFCRATFKRDRKREEKQPMQFCTYCGTRIRPSASTIDVQSVFLEDHKPKADEIIGHIGQYSLLKSIGKGGMGEVFLAFDTVAGRRVALKRIRPDLVSSPLLKHRFVREARITSQLIHPAIIPIYAIHIDGDLIYYTMPYIQGETLKQMLRRARAGDPKITALGLVRLFLQVAHAIAYAHSKGVLHRDIKPENIIIGPYGEVIILDWGLTKLLEEADDEQEDKRDPKTSTRIGKPVGTVTYMAPERAQGTPASKQTDVYALGAILYFILTLTPPFARKNMKNFTETWQDEEFVAPEVRAPYRDIPQALSEITKKALSPDPKDRYQSCDELIHHIENFLEGRADWFHQASLSIHKKNDWEFQEHIFLAAHTAIARSSEFADWYGLMISKEGFSENILLDIHLHLDKYCKGIGFIVGAPNAVNRNQLHEGYTLWFSTHKGRSTTLFRSLVSVYEDPDLFLEPDHDYHIRIEKKEQTITLTLNHSQKFTYVSHFPVIGTHVGILSKDENFTIKAMNVYVGSQNIMVNCLTVPDAFLAHGDYEKALTEYRRIGALFSGRAEGREAMYRAGLTLLEQAKHTEKEGLLDLARDEFAKLRHTPGAPLEYMGKALIYELTREYEEEAKCFELAFRRYKNHPSLQLLIEHIALRMHETCRTHRVAAYYFMSLALRFATDIVSKPSSKQLFQTLNRHWEVPTYLLSQSDDGDEQLRLLRFCLGISFWLGQPLIIKEIFEELIEMPVLPIIHIVDCLVLFGFFDRLEILEKSLKQWKELLCSDEQKKYAHFFEALELAMIQDTKEKVQMAKKKLSDGSPHNLEAHILLLLMEQAYKYKNHALTLDLYDIKGSAHWSGQLDDELLSRAIEAAILNNDLERVQRLFDQTDKILATDERSALFFPYGCILAIESGREAAINHFSQVLDAPYPRSWLIGAHVISRKILLSQKGWFSRSFPYERYMLARQLQLFAHIVGPEHVPGFDFLDQLTF